MCKDASRTPLKTAIAWAIGGIAMLITAACSSPSRLDAVPPSLQNQAAIPGMAGVRYRQGHFNEMLGDGVESVSREVAVLRASGHQGPLPAANFLAISGGGEDGAFGAGLLVGWTAAGTRPEFKVVTGVSTGALTAPFAFLGPRYDDQLREVYTAVSAKDVLEQRGLLAALFDDAMADNAPLRGLVRRLVNQQMLEAIAVEHAKGRVLLIGTTDLDARRGVIWNVGKIAASGHPKALELLQNILVASAAIPGAFPPMMIDVEIDGKRYQEMHVDGGATAQVFIYPPSLNIRATGFQRERRAYVIRNARLDPDWAHVERNTLSIAGRAITSLIQTQGVGDLYRIYTTAERDQVEFNLAFIPDTFTTQLKAPFDREYMKALFDVGYELAVKGYSWAKTPPGFATSAPQSSVK
jgi:hypothetical protein